MFHREAASYTQTGCHATFATIGAVPVGEATWLHYNGSILVERKLKVAELSVAEVAEFERDGVAADAAGRAASFSQANRVRLLQTYK